MGAPLEDEIASLLGQCSAEELSQILAQIGAERPERPPQLAPAPPAHLKAVAAPPSGPPPAHGKRPGGRFVGPASPTGGSQVPSAEQLVPTGQVSFTLEDVQRMLADHSKAVLSEVRRVVAAAPPPLSASAAPLALHAPGDGGVGAGVLAEVLGARDREVAELEARLEELTGQLGAKDQGVEALSADLDRTMREVRHRQLDLEFHQLKLEEKVRTNAEMEQVQRKLAAQVEDASLSARHAALDVETCRTTPRAVRVQGSLPWTLRKNRPGSYM